MLIGVALIFGLVFIALAIVGFLYPLVMTNHLLFNVFEVSLIQNIAHLLTGLIGLSASTSASSARLYFKIVGFVYGLIAIFGFAANGNLWLLHINLADSFFYLIAAVVALYFGFTSKIATDYQIV